MGRSNRVKPARLADKLRQIRAFLELSQPQMIIRLDYKDSALTPANMSEFESGRREPTLQLLLRYARVSGVSVESIIDDEMDLEFQTKT